MKSVTIQNLTFDEFLSAAEIAEIVKGIADQINKDYAGREPLFICVLNGAFIYASDLFKCINLPVEITFVRLKSYEGTATTGKVNMLIPLQTSVKDRDIIIVEDIVDTGLTMHGFIKYLKQEGARSVELTSFLLKPDSIQYPDATPKYIGKSIPTKFVLGYVLDFDEKGRNLDSLYVLRTEE